MNVVNFKAMRIIILNIVLLLSLGINVFAQTVNFSGNARAVYEEIPEKSTGLDKIFILYGTSGVSMSYEAVTATSQVKWYRYGSLGGGYAEEISGINKNGATTTLSQIIPNCGYIIEEGNKRTYLWVVDYVDYELNLTAIQPSNDQDCGSIALEVSGSGADIQYTAINGVSKKINREITLAYNTLEWNGDGKQWVQKKVEKSYAGFKSVIHETAPLCDTEFVLTGDKFLKFWGEKIVLSSTFYNTHSIDVQVEVEQTDRNVPNEKKEESTTSLGGSAPVEIVFTAYPTDAVSQREWQLSTDSEFRTVERSYTDDVYQETFNDAGTFYVRYLANNAGGTCEIMSETYTVSIGESSLICPNAFSPQASPGVNDEWKVQFKSIVSFKCSIFNRWGVQICELNDPSQGWDGKYKGKYVNPGVYYYVIQAKGADGKKYNLKGDINIINYVGKESTGENSGEGVIE